MLSWDQLLIHHILFLGLSIINLPPVWESRSISLLLSKDRICIPLGLKLGLELRYAQLLSEVSFGGLWMRTDLKRSGFEIPRNERGAGDIDGLELCQPKDIFRSGDGGGTRSIVEAVLELPVQYR